MEPVKKKKKKGAYRVICVYCTFYLKKKAYVGAIAFSKNP